MVKDDSELIDEMRNGSLTAFDSLMQRYQQLVFTIAYTVGHSEEDAMDISQDVFLKVYQKLNAYRGKGSFKGWISRIAKNESINGLKKINRRKQTENLEETLAMPVSQDPSQEDELLARENRATLLRRLFNLNTRYRLAVVLRYYKDMPIRQIAETMQCSEGMVKNMLYRSLQRLKHEIHGQHHSKGA